MWRSWHCHCQLPLVVNCKLYRSWRHSSHCFETISCTNIRGVLCFSWTQGHTEHIEFNTWIISSPFITCYITTMLHPLSAMPLSFLPQIFLEIFFHFPDKWKGLNGDMKIVVIVKECEWLKERLPLNAQGPDSRGIAKNILPLTAISGRQKSFSAVCFGRGAI